MILRVRNLAVEYRGVKALDGVDLELAAGSWLAVAGASGSGKSTLAQALLSALPADARQTGEIWFSPTLRRWRGRTAAWIPQEPSLALNPRLKAGAQLDECLRAAAPELSAAARRSRADGLLESVGISAERGRDYPHQWSGGMQQRLLIAMALAPQPDLLIADEPTAALDVQTQAAILGLLGTIRKQSPIAMLLITHDLAVASQVADEVVVLGGGKVIERGRLPEIWLHPGDPVTKAMVEAQPA